MNTINNVDRPAAQRHAIVPALAVPERPRELVLEVLGEPQLSHIVCCTHGMGESLKPPRDWFTPTRECFSRGPHPYPPATSSSLITLGLVTANKVMKSQNTIRRLFKVNWNVKEYEKIM